MPPHSKQLVDLLIPEYRHALKEDFVAALQRKSNSICSIAKVAGIGKACAGTPEIDSTIQRYQSVRQTLLRYSNVYDALSREVVNVLPGIAPDTSPVEWSQLGSRVYVRLTGGTVFGERANLEIRVLPSALLSQKSIAFGNMSYREAGVTSSVSSSSNDLIDIGVEAMLAFPRDGPGLQALVGVVDSQPTGFLVQVEGPLLETQNMLTNLMWVDCIPSSVGNAVAYVIEPLLPPGSAQTPRSVADRL